MVEKEYLVEEAAKWAIEAHYGQKRKVEGLPYILHPFEVAAIAGAITTDKEVIAAALLHDTVEDAGKSLDEIRELFGERVAYLVSTETENKREDRPGSETWMIRKQESLEVLKNATDIGVKALWLSDKLANLRSLNRTFQRRGPSFWSFFNQSNPTVQKWYYESVKDMTSVFSRTGVWKEYSLMLDMLFGGVKIDEQH